MTIPPFLEKLLSKELFAEATALILAQPRAITEEEKAANHQRVRAALLTFAETLDDQVVLIPFAGPILKAIVDSPSVDAEEVKLVDFIISSVYRPLKETGQVGK